MKWSVILAASSAAAGSAALGFFIGISFSVQMAPEVKAVQCGTFLRSNCDADANSDPLQGQGQQHARQILGATQNSRAPGCSTATYWLHTHRMPSLPYLDGVIRLRDAGRLVSRLRPPPMVPT